MDKIILMHMICSYCYYIHHFNVMQSSYILVFENRNKNCTNQFCISSGCPECFEDSLLSGVFILVNVILFHLLKITQYFFSFKMIYIFKVGAGYHADLYIVLSFTCELCCSLFAL